MNTRVAAVVAGVLVAFAPVSASPVLAVSRGALAVQVGAVRQGTPLPGAGARARLVYGGGPVLLTVRVHLVYWGWQGHGGDPSSEAPQLEGFLNGAGGSRWLDTVTQYCQGVKAGSTKCTGAGSAQMIQNLPGVLQDVWSDDSYPAPTNPSQGDVQSEAARAAAQFGIDPALDQDDVVFVALAHGVVIPMTGVCGYHEAEPGSSSYPRLAYAVMEYVTDDGYACGQGSVNSGPSGGLDGVSIIAGHELAEAMTDPVPPTGWQAGNEIADMCLWVSTGSGAARNITLSTGTFPVQSLWSNVDNLGKGACVVVANVAHGTGPPPGVDLPGPATNLLAATGGPNEAYLYWTPPGYDGGAHITAYAIASLPASPQGVLVSTYPTSSRVQHLIPNSYYAFTISAWNGTYWGAWSDWSNYVWIS